MRLCGICAVEAVVHIHNFDFCSNCNHFSSDISLDEVEVLNYYEQKDKWNTFKARDKSGKKIEVEERYPKRVEYVLGVLKDYGVSASGLSLLDVGTAAGWFLYSVGDVFKSKIGSDIDSGAVGYAREILKQPVVVGSIDNEQIRKKAPYDIITCFHVLEHVVDPLEFLTEVSTMLKEDGFLFVGVPCVTLGTKPINFYNEFQSYSKIENAQHEHIHHFTELSMLYLAMKANFEECKRIIWNYKGDSQLPEFFLVLRKTSTKKTVFKRTVFERINGLKILCSVMYWAVKSRVMGLLGVG